MVDRELPAGSVTLLFTDIEGSTRLIEELGETAYISALVEHRRLLRAAFAAHRGVEVDTQGDARRRQHGLQDSPLPEPEWRSAGGSGRCRPGASGQNPVFPRDVVTPAVTSQVDR